MNLQEQVDVAVVIPTILRPHLLRAVESVFQQDISGTVQVLIGVDKHIGDAALLDEIRRTVPPNMHVTVIDPGYSTSVRHGGVYSNRFSGALRTILSYLANSRYVAYLDDDNWWADDHLSGLLAAIQDKDCAFAKRYYAHPESGEALCEDHWESLGPGKGIYAERFGGFVDTSCLMLDKTTCHMIFPFWSLAMGPNGDGEDRMVFDAILRSGLRFGESSKPSCYYSLDNHDAMHANREAWIKSAGGVLPDDWSSQARYLGREA